MGIVNSTGIITKIKNWEKTLQGQQRISMAKKTKRSGVISNVSIQGKELAENLLKVIQSHLPNSISNNIDLTTSYISTPEYQDGLEKYKIEISFPKESLHRESLYPEGYSAGIENIIVLLNKGYSAKRSAYGYWNTAGTEIKSLQTRPAQMFIQEAIADFNSQYGQEYMCFVELADEYT